MSQRRTSSLVYVCSSDPRPALPGSADLLEQGPGLLYGAGVRCLSPIIIRVCTVSCRILNKGQNFGVQVMRLSYLHAMHQGTLVYSHLSLLSHCGLILS